MVFVLLTIPIWHRHGSNAIALPCALTGALGGRLSCGDGWGVRLTERGLWQLDQMIEFYGGGQSGGCIRMPDHRFHIAGRARPRKSHWLVTPRARACLPIGDG